MEFMYSFLNEKMDSRPAYGFSNQLRAAVEKDEDTPSPLEYYANYYGELGAANKGFSFGGRFRRRSDLSTGPGPGEYFIADDIRRLKNKSGRTTFGSRPPNVWSINDESTPGPHDYMPYEDVGSFYPKKGFSFGQRTKGRRISDIPGPGEYYSEKAFLFKNTPAYTFGGKNHHLNENRVATPSPLDYHPEHVNEFGSAYKTRGFTFGSKLNGVLFSKKDSQNEPGPGDYAVGVYRKSRRNPATAKGFSFGRRFPTLIK